MIDLKHAALASGRDGVRSTLLFNPAMQFFSFHIFDEIGSSIFPKMLYVKLTFRDQKSPSFDQEKMLFKI